MNRIQAEADFQNKFVSFGLSEHFDFIRREWGYRGDRRALVRCKRCGTEFLTYSAFEVFRGRQSKLSCPECGLTSFGTEIWIRTTACNDAMAFYTQGHSVKETAEKYGVSTATINDAVKVRGLSNGKKQRAAEAAAKAAEDKKQKKAVKERLILEAAELKRKKEAEREARANEKRKKAEEKAEREAKRLAENPLGLSSYQLEREKRYDENHICKVCGKTYTLREYAESIGSSYCRDSGYCSAECRDKSLRERVKASHKGRQDSHRHRAIKFGCEYDPSVTLARLIKRDGLQCRLCGGVCDPDDHGYSNWVGPLSPSIDHIVPMSKGGGHIWSNVQVAHVICNSLKGSNAKE